MREVVVHRLGQMPYAQALELQKRVQAARIRGLIPDTLLLLEHPPVVTLGRGAKAHNLLLSEEALAERGFELHQIGRGGDVTYHGPGQLVGYPIVDLSPDRQDVRRYVRDLEELMIRVCADFGVTAGRVDKMNGTWVGNDKIGAIGVRISRWVTLHGFALNVSTDLSHFGVIVPCGLVGKGVTSLQALGKKATLPDAMDAVEKHFAALFDATLRPAEQPPLHGLDPAAWGPEPWRDARAPS